MANNQVGVGGAAHQPQLSEAEALAIRQAKVWTTLSMADVSGHTESRLTQGVKLNYLSWAWAWAETMKKYPTASYEVGRDPNTGWSYVASPLGIMVHTRVTIEGVTRSMWLPVMDGANRALKCEAYVVQKKDYKTGRMVDVTVPAATMMDINKAIMRCLTKNLAMFGLGLNLYAGEDLPVGVEDDGGSAANAAPTRPTAAASKSAELAAAPVSANTANIAKTPAALKSAVVQPKLVKRSAAGVAAAAQKSREVWAAFKALPRVAAMDEAARTAAFNKLVVDTLGRAPGRDISADDWMRVAEAIDVEGVL